MKGPKETSVSIPIRKNRNSSSNTFDEGGSMLQEIPSGVSAVQEMHHSFGNNIVQDALQNEGAELGSMVHGILSLEMAGMNMQGNMGPFSGNSGIQRILARKRVEGGSHDEVLPDASDSRLQNIRQNGGASLPDRLRVRLEDSFQHQFEHVRLHTSGIDANSAEALNADAFTVENHIFFGAGKYNPQSRVGMELLAHELTHVVQYDEGRLTNSSGEMEVSSPTDAVEMEAVRRGAEVAQEIGGFSCSSVEESISVVDSFFDETMSSTITAHMQNRLGGQESAQTTSLIARDEKKTDTKESEPEVGAPSSVTISIDKLGSLLATKVGGEASPIYRLNPGDDFGLTFNSNATLSKVEGKDEWTGSVSYAFKKNAPSKGYEYKQPPGSTGTLSVKSSGSGSLDLKPPEKIIATLSPIGTLELSKISIDKGGLAFEGKFTPGDLTIIKKLIPAGTKPEDVSFVIKRSNGTWGTGGDGSFTLKAGELEVFTVKVSASGEGDKTVYSISATKTFGKEGRGKISVGGSLQANGINTGQFEVYAAFGANSLSAEDAKEKAAAKTKAFNLSGELKVGYNSITGPDKPDAWYTTGTIKGGLTIPAMSTGLSLEGGIKLDKGDVILTAKVAGTKDIDSEAIPSALGGSAKRQIKLEGTGEYSLTKSTLLKAGGSLSFNITPEASGSIKINYDGTEDLWTAAGQIKKDFVIPGFEKDKTIPDDPPRLKEKIPALKFPLVPGVYVEAFVDGSVFLEMKRPKLTSTLDLGLNLNKNDLISKFLVTLEGTGSVAAKGDISANAGLNLNAVVAEVGAGLYGALKAEGKADIAIKGTLGYDGGKGTSKESAGDASGLIASAVGAVSLSASLKGEAGIYAYYDTCFTRMKRIDIPLYSVDILKLGPIGAKAGISYSSAAGLEFKADGDITGYDRYDWSPLEKEFMKIKQQIGIEQEGEPIKANLTNKGYSDDGWGGGDPEFYIKLGAGTSDTKDLPKGRSTSYEIFVKNKDKKSLGLNVYEDDTVGDDHVLTGTWSPPFSAYKGNSSSFNVGLESKYKDWSVQKKEDGKATTDNVQATAAEGVSGGGGSLPYASQIQKSFGKHNIGGISSHTDQKSSQASSDIGAKAYATGNSVAFGKSPDLHTVAHEVAHIIQQKGGVALKGGVGESGDKYEKNADAVADMVVKGESAEGLLDQFLGSGSDSGAQKKDEKTKKEKL